MIYWYEVIRIIFSDINNVMYNIVFYQPVIPATDTYYLYPFQMLSIGRMIFYLSVVSVAFYVIKHFTK